MLIKIILGITVLIIMTMVFWNISKTNSSSIDSSSDDAKFKLADGVCDFPGLGQKCASSCPSGYVEGGIGNCNDGQKCCKEEPDEK